MPLVRNLTVQQPVLEAHTLGIIDRLPKSGNISFRKIIRSASELRNAVRAAKANVVSIDMFDTLVYRSVLQPNDVFYLQHRAVSSILPTLSAADWLNLRKNTEAKLAEKEWPKEVELATIYAGIKSHLGLDESVAHALLETELSIEAELIHPYRDLVAVLRALQAEGTTIVIATDTYLPGAFIRSILDSFLDFDYMLMCSSVIGHTKRSGAIFDELRSKFFGRELLHFGDNPYSDLKIARRHGVAAFQICWERQRRLATDNVSSYARAMGATRLLTPWDGETASKTVSPLKEIAWLWSFVLADFLFSLRRYAERINATDIWFLSRDGETIFKSTRDVPKLFDGFNCRYVHGSRACLLPVAAALDPDLHEKWRGRKPTIQDANEGELSRKYYEGFVESKVSRVLIVDSGWKGRLQVLLQLALPKSVVVFGYYFSLLPDAESTTVAQSETFLQWDESVVNQALVEALSGFEEPSAIGFQRNGSVVEPIFRQTASDRSPPQYCEWLRLYLSELLLGHLAHEMASLSLLFEERISAVQRMALYPDLRLMEAFGSWSIGTLVNGSDAGSMVSGGTAGIANKLLGRGVQGNIWPAAAIWTLTRQKHLGRLLQHIIRWRLVTKRIIHRLHRD